jgi:hypothetical protein
MQLQSFNRDSCLARERVYLLHSVSLSQTVRPRKHRMRVKTRKIGGRWKKRIEWKSSVWGKKKAEFFVQMEKVCQSKKN